MNCSCLISAMVTFLGTLKVQMRSIEYVGKCYYRLCVNKVVFTIKRGNYYWRNVPLKSRPDLYQLKFCWLHNHSSFFFHCPSSSVLFLTIKNSLLNSKVLPLIPTRIYPFLPPSIKPRSIQNSYPLVVKGRRFFYYLTMSLNCIHIIDLLFIQLSPRFIFS
jgi:hypothetical protein